MTKEQRDRRLPSSLKHFTRRLQEETIEGCVTNFYNAKRTNARRYNLERYLSYIYEQGTDTLLVGEAPGYNGCRLTGVPFTSEHIIRYGVKVKKLFGIEQGYKASTKRAKKEQSASSMWDVLEQLEELPLLWNAFPFHPYQKDNVDSNRKPTVKELEIGRRYLRDLIEIFDIKEIIAIGNVADESLMKMKIDHIKVRHPSYGGKRMFKKQLLSYYERKAKLESTKGLL